MRAIWSGSISFGLINIPVKLYSGSRERALKFRMLDKKTNSPIHYQKVRESDSKKVEYDDIVKGYELEEGKFVILDKDDFKHANPRKTSTIDIVRFSDAEDISAKYYEKPYYLEPEKKAGKAYVLLRDALEKTGKVGIATFVMKDHEHVCAIVVDGKTLQLLQLRFDDELALPKGIKVPSADYSKNEEKMAISLINQLTAPFNPKDFKDSYTNDLMKVIKKKAKGKKISIKEEKPSDDADMKDLMAMLKKSLELETA